LKNVVLFRPTKKDDMIYRGDLQVRKGKKEELGNVVYEGVKIKGEWRGTKCLTVTAGSCMQ